MRRTRAQEIKRLQKKLIPVNLLVCILCIVASLSLFFMPVVKINLATIVGDKTLRSVITDVAVTKINSFIEQAGDSIDGSLDGSIDGSGNGSDNGSGETGGENAGENGSEGETPELNPDNNGGAVTYEELGGETNGEGSEGGSDNGSEGNEGNEGDQGGEGNEGNENNGDVTIKDLLKEVDVTELVTQLVNEIFDELKADISVSAKNSLTVFSAQDKAETLMDELFFHKEKGFVTNLKSTLISGFGNAFNAAGNIVQSAVVKAVVVPALKENLPKEYADLVVAEDLQKTIDSLDSAKSAQEASDTIINYIDGLSENSEEIDKLTPEQKADITKQITELYDKTVEHTRDDVTGEDNFTVEAMISVMASEMLGGVGDFNLSDIIAGFANSGNGGSNGGNGTQPPENPDPADDGAEASIVKFLILSKLALAEGELAGGSGETGGGNPDISPDENPDVNPDENAGGENGEKEVVKYTTYRAMGEGLAKDFIGDDLEGSLKSAIKNAVGGNEAVFGYYGYIFIGIGFFIILWLILFLFAFFHMFAKNKRFMMWYVKLFCAWPCIIFYIVPLMVKNVLATAFPELYNQFIDTIAQAIGNAANAAVTTEQATSIMNAALASVQSFAWISGICYLLLWIISICWAFPIKHKIRKLKKGR